MTDEMVRRDRKVTVSKSMNCLAFIPSDLLSQHSVLFDIVVFLLPGRYGLKPHKYLVPLLKPRWIEGN